MKPNILFLIVDSLRSDKFYGFSKTSQTPTLDNLLQNGIYFEQTISSADATILSWSSIFTGKFPFKTGIRSSKFNKLSSETQTLFDVLKKQNYHLYSYLPTLSETVGLFPEFENDDAYYDFYMGLTNGLGDKIIERLNSNELKESWFFTVHSMDLHDPISIDKKFNNTNFGENYYAQKISELDFWLSKIIQKIDFSNTILILTSDHGCYIKSIMKNDKEINFNINANVEKTTSQLTRKIPKFLNPLKNKLFFTREKLQMNKKESILSEFDLKPHEKRALISGRADKDHFLFDECLRVPLLMVGQNLPQNKKITEQVRTVDIFSTILDLIKSDLPSNTDGKSLLNLLTNQDLKENIAYIESSPLVLSESNDVIGIRTSKFKYFRDKNNPQKRVHLYDLKSDHFEDKNIADVNTDQVNKCEEILQNMIKDFDNKDTEEDDLNTEEIENELRKLGYV
jgi:arylsulfatase A-like enzyme